MPVSDADVVMEWRELMEGLTVLEARSREWPREWLEEGREQGREQGREELRSLLARQAVRRFGVHIGERLTAALADMRDPTRLEEVGELILDCDGGADLLRRINGKLG